MSATNSGAETQSEKPEATEVFYTFQAGFWIASRGSINERTGRRGATAHRMVVPSDGGQLALAVTKFLHCEICEQTVAGRPFVIAVVGRPRTLVALALLVHKQLSQTPRSIASLLKCTPDGFLVRAAAGRLVAVRLVHDYAVLQNPVCDSLYIAKAEIDSLLYDTIRRAIANGAPPVQWIHSEVELDVREHLLAQQFTLEWSAIKQSE